MKTILVIAEMLLLFSLASSQNLCPQLFSTAGEKFINSNYQLDWSIGEIETETYISGQNILSQGFNQGNYSITALAQNEGMDLKIYAYPNPANDFILLEVNDLEFGKFEFQITDLSGFILLKSKLFAAKQQINLSNFECGSYILTVRKSEIQLQSFIIIKNSIR